MGRAALVGLLIGGAWGCASLECGDGTHEDGGACVPDVSCGPGTELSGGACGIHQWQSGIAYGKRNPKADGAGSERRPGG